MKIQGLKTIFLDIDGTLLRHYGVPNMQSKWSAIVLLGVENKLAEWHEKGYKIILVTGRRESEREDTIKQLSNVSIQYDLLIMGINPGERVLINDLKPDSDEPTASAICIKRNEGISHINI